jgi:hypothetical protein
LVAQAIALAVDKLCYASETHQMASKSLKNLALKNFLNLNEKNSKNP